MLSHGQFFGTPCAEACQAPLSVEFSRQEYWSGLPFPPPGVLPDPGIEPASPALAGRFLTASATWQVWFGTVSTMAMKGKVKSLSRVLLCYPMDCSLPGFSVHGIFHARVLEWVAISFSRGSSRERTWVVSHVVGRCFTLWATREAHHGHGPYQNYGCSQVPGGNGGEPWEWELSEVVGCWADSIIPSFLLLPVSPPHKMWLHLWVGDGVFNPP